LEEAGRRADLDVTHSFARAYAFDAGRDEMARLVKAGPAEGYFCGDDVLSIGALSAIADQGLRVPADIGLIGLNDMEMAGWENIGLTTIRQPIPKIVETSIELMVAMLDDPATRPETRIFPCELVTRKTL